MLAGALIIGAAALTSCSDDSSAAAEDATVLDLNLGRFILEPALLEAPAGDLVLRITNTDPDLVHDFVVHGKGTRRLAPGESQTLEIPEVAAGEYPMWCDVPGHAAAGQTGTLGVTPAVEPAAASS
jgi:uncharacterized cupredoxin-like copper-binding protein